MSNAEERAYQFIMEDPGVATILTVDTFSIFYLYLEFMDWVLLSEVSFRIKVVMCMHLCW